MADPVNSLEETKHGHVSGNSKFLTAIGHSCGLAALLGIFISASAFSSDPNSGMLRVGIMVTLVGVAGFIAAQWVGKKRR